VSGFSIVVAADDAWGIGREGDLPWHLPGDMAWFREVTTGEDPAAARNTVIMGRKTWDTIPARFRPLPNRRNVVVSRNRSLVLEGDAEVAHSLDEALDIATDGEQFVIGGGMLYAEALSHPRCERLFITHVEGNFGCDTTIPAPSPEFVCSHAADAVTQSGVTYRITTYERG
jgi:dihydrofolate reductase